MTRGPGRLQGSPAWSPDGQSIVFDSQPEDGYSDIWTIGVSGSGLRQVTHDPAEDVVPFWSRDGRFIYFRSLRTGRREVWRTPASGGTDEQVSRTGGSSIFQSLDGRTLYWRSLDGALLARPTDGREERTILPCVRPWNSAAAPGGVFHVECGTAAASVARLRVLRYWDAATGADRVVGTLDVSSVSGITVAPDGKTIVYGGEKNSSDLMMIEHFR